VQQAKVERGEEDQNAETRQQRIRLETASATRKKAVPAEYDDTTRSRVVTSVDAKEAHTAQRRAKEVACANIA